MNGEEIEGNNQDLIESKTNGETKEAKKEKNHVSKKEARKAQKLLKTKKRARIVVHNLAFQVNFNPEILYFYNKYFFL